tara:strand:- start:1662 stop:2576 length:915 start_codon:yes stop_codon:yes gene_type:complete
MAKKGKTNKHNKAAVLENDPRVNMYEGKDRVLTTEDEATEATEDTDIKAVMEATPEVEGFIDSSKPAPKEPEGVQGDPETEIRYKKRYDDLKKYYDQKLSEWKQEKETLEAQKKAIEEPQPKYAPPKTPEELDRFKDQYPDVYQVVETISHKMATQQVEDLQAEIGRLTAKEKKTKVQSAYRQLLNNHPDFEEIKTSQEFLDWLEQQPKSISEGITKNNTDPVWASRTVDLYKADIGINRKQTSNRSKDAAKAVTKSTAREINTTGKSGRTWKMSEIQKLKPWEYEQYEAEIDQAVKSGRVINE